MNQLSKCPIGRPSTAEPLPDYFSGQVESAAQICERSKYAPHRKVARASSIKGLLSGRCPSAVIRFIALVIVASFKCQRGGFFPHVRKKVLKLQPPIADLYSSTSVVCPSWIAWVGTPLDHHTPRGIGRASFPSLVASVTVSGVVFFRHGIGPFVHNAVSAVGDRRQPALTAILN